MSDYWKKKIDELEKSTSKTYWEKKEDELKSIQQKQEESKKAIAVKSTSAGAGTSIFEVDDLAPVREDAPWYKRGLFADGYQFGDVTKSILGIEDKKDSDESLIKTYSDPVPLETMEELEAKRDEGHIPIIGVTKPAEYKFYNELRNQKYLAQTSKTLSETKMDGTNRSILEEMEVIAGMESGKEKRQRKKAVIEKMEAMGIDSSDYALFVDDTNFTAENFAKWLWNSMVAGLNNFNMSATNTADKILGDPLKKLGWENNPVSKLNDYYTALYENSKYISDLSRQKLGGGGGWGFAEQFVEGTTAAVPNMLLAIMTSGASLEGTTAALTQQAAYQGAGILEKAGMTAAKMIKNPQYWLSFGRTYGNSYDKAIEEGADETTAAFGATISSLFNAGIEIGITGGSGIQGLPQELKEGGMNKILPWVKSSLEEGGEEGLQKFVDEIVGKVLYQSDDEILNPLEYGKEMFMGTLSGATLGGGQMIAHDVDASIRNAVQDRKASALTENEQKVFDKVVADEIAKAKENGEVSKKDEAKIREDVRTRLEKGDISTDTIEEVLGGDSFKSYQDTVKAEEDLVNQEKTLTEEYNKLNKMVNEKMTGEQQVRRDELRTLLPELRSKIEEQGKSTKRSDLKTKLSEEVKSFVQGSRLAESYNEIDRRRQAFQADLSQYDEKQRAVVQRAVESGILNNTNKTHDFVDLVAKLSAGKNVPFNFTNNAKLKESGFAMNGKTINGYVSNGEVTVNIQSAKALNTVVGHEITHVLEGTALYTELQNAVVQYAKTKGDYQSRYDALSKLYESVEGANIDAELTADLVGDYLFTDSDFINNLSTNHRNVFQKIYDEVKYLLKVATAGSKEARELERVKKAFENAYRETKNTADSGVKYSIREDIVDVNGKEYNSVVELDKTVSKRVLSEPKKFLSYIEKNLVGLKIPVIDVDGNTEVIEFAGANEKVTKNNKRHPVLGELAYTKGDTRKQVIVNAGEVIQESVYDPEYSSTDNEHGWLDRNGWESRKTYVLTQDGMIYEAYLKIAKAQDGRNILYAVNLDINKGIAVDQGATSKKAAVLAAMPSGDKVAQDGKNVKGQFSISDSTGRQLSQDQAEYFKDSKVRDENGNLKVVYHGSPADFNTFSLEYLGTNGTAEGYGFYFTDKKSIAENYSRGREGQQNGQPGKLFEVYLDIKKPLSDTEVTMTRAQFKKFLTALNKQVDADGEPLDVLSNYGDVEWEGLNKVLNYAMEIEYDGSDSDVNMVHSIINGTGNMKVVFDVLRKTVGYDGIIVNEASWGGDQTIYIAFHPEQIKNVDNLNPTSYHDTRRSLSNAGQNQKQYGNYNVYGEDVALEAPAQEEVAPVPETAVKAEPAVDQTTVEDLFPDDTATVQEEYENLLAERDDIRGAMDVFAAVGDTARAEQMMAEYEAVQARIAEIDADEADRLASIQEEDAPPEVDNRPEAEADNVPLTKKLVDDLTRSVRHQLGLSARRSTEVRELIQRYNNGEFPSKAHLYTEIAERFGTYTESSVDEDLKAVKSTLRKIGISVDPFIKSEIADYGQVMRRNFGKVRFTNDGLPVDVAYREFQELLPGYFPEDIYVPTDQLMRIIEVANMETTMKAEHEIDAQTLEEVTDTIMNGVGEFKQNWSENLANRYGKESFDSLMKSGDRYVPPLRFDNEPARVRHTRPAIESVQADPDDIAPVYDTSTGQQSLMPEPEMDAPISPAVAEVLTEEPETQRKKTSFWSLFQENVLDNGMVFENLSLKKKNRELQAKWNFTRYSQSRAQKLIGEGTTGVKSLDSIRQQVEKPGLTKSFYEYLYHKHNSDRMRLTERYQNTENKAVFGDSVTAEMSDAEAERLERTNPSFKRLAQDVYKYNTHLRQMLVDGGIITQELADLWQEMYPHFVPIRRDLSVELTDTGYVDERKIGVNAPIKRATGGSSNILPLFDTMALTTLQTYKAIAKNNFGVELKNALGTTVATEQMDLESAIESVYNIDDLLQAGRNGKNATFTVYENGKKVTFEITDEMYNALKPKSDGMAYTNKLLNTASSLHRGVLTEYNPVFMITNAIKDAQDVLINSQHPMKTYMRFPAALREISKNGNWYQEYMENGGGDNTYFDNDTNTFNTEEKGAQKILGIPPLSWISKANNFIEKVPRMAEYIASRESGRSVEVSMLDAARVTTNFAAGGHLTKFLNRNGATFLNASVQGAVQQARNFREAKMNGLKGWTQLASKFAIAGLPALLLNGLMWDDDDEYEELSDYVKQNYYVVAKFDDGKFVRIPKGRAMAVIQNAFEQVSNMAAGDDEADLKTFLELVVSNLAPNNPIENNILAPIIQVKNNETWYGEDLVPTRLQDLPAEEQFDESTDAISRWLGEKLKLSPYKINYLLDQYTGGVGDTILPMLTPEAESGDDTFFGNMIAPLKSKFTTDSVMNNQNVTDFYDLKDELAINANSRNATDEDVLMYKYINSVSSELGELYGNKREYQNTGDSDSAKYTLVRKTQKEIVEMMEEALNVYSDVQIDGDHAVVGDRHFERNKSGQWEKMSDEKVAKYLATSAAGDAPYATDGVNNYRWYQKDGATDGDWRKITDDELKKQNEVTSALGITPEEYWGNKEEYSYAYENPGKYAFAQTVGGYESYMEYSDALNDIKADKDKFGKSISGTRKTKVAEYISSLDIPMVEKYILFKSEYPSTDDYNYEIIDYVNSMSDMSFEEKIEVLRTVGFDVDAEGNIYW